MNTQTVQPRQILLRDEKKKKTHAALLGNVTRFVGFRCLPPRSRPPPPQKMWRGFLTSELGETALVQNNHDFFQIIYINVFLVHYVNTRFFYLCFNHLQLLPFLLWVHFVLSDVCAFVWQKPQSKCHFPTIYRKYMWDGQRNDVFYYFTFPCWKLAQRKLTFQRMRELCTWQKEMLQVNRGKLNLWFYDHIRCKDFLRGDFIFE